MRAAIRIAAKDLRLRVRDRSAFIIGLGAPLILAFVFNLILGGALSVSGPDLTYGLVDADGSEASATFDEVLTGLDDAGVITLHRFDDVASAETAVEEGDVSAFFLIPSGFGEAVSTGGQASIEVVGDVDNPITTDIAASIAGQFGSGVEATRLAVLTTADILGVPPTPEVVAQFEGDPTSAAFSFQITELTTSVRQLDGSTYFAAGMAIFFMFFTVQYGVIGLLEEQIDGTLNRLLAAPISRGSILGGKAILSSVLGVTSMLVLAAATTLFMGADWGPIPGVVLLVVTAVAAGVGLTGIGGAFAKTPESAGNFGSIVAVVLGLLGGVFFPLGQGDDLLSKLSLLTPHAWFLRGLGDISGGASWTQAIPAATVLLGFALVSGTIAALIFRKKLSR